VFTLAIATLARDLARRCNESSAELVREYPQRFGALALLLLPDVDAALDEIEYALDTLGSGMEVVVRLKSLPSLHCSHE
jgi:predicted TIM-barrel fold metal-dependent hydrolase